jgi:ribulose-phosphate 3-epimerase
MKIAASILSADFARLRDQIREAEDSRVDYIHVDVMDGRFVPNITVGPLVVEAVRRCTSLPLDVHLMIEEPERYLGDFIAAGASIVTVHQEACRHLQRVLAEIHERGAQAGVSLCPATPVGMIEEVVAELDLLLIMTVNPGFGGQSLIPSCLAKVQRARQLLDRHGSRAALEVDGGINTTTAAAAVEAGADILVAGSAIFTGGAVGENVARLRASAAQLINR